MKYIINSFILLLVSASTIFAQDLKLLNYNDIVCGAEQFEQYSNLIKSKRVGVVANKASLVGDKNLVDFLLEKEIRITKVFTPEHGFKLNKANGEEVLSDMDSETGIQIVSLYGKHKKPTYSDLENLDIIIFDLQDVGVRFYTYISTLTYVMEACAENSKPLIVLDRPNPNGFYVDGPVLEDEFKSFVGMHPVPVVYGMTIGEYAKMINGEGWLLNGARCNLTVIKLKNYNHNNIVKLKVKPSPNLPDWKAVYLYPSLCFFEGTVVSVGRGTDFPFKVYGHPDIVYGSFVFTPSPNEGSKKPKLEGKHCYGQSLSGYAENYANQEPGINLIWLIESYKTISKKEEFFNSYFNTLAGTDKLRNQIEKGWSADKIKKSWSADIKKFKKIRQKYLIYN